MESLAEFKRELAVGSKWEMFRGIDYAGNTRSEGIRTVVKVQTNAVGFQTDDRCADDTKVSWLEFPKAKQCLFILDPSHPEPTIRINFGGGYLVYRKVLK